MTAVAAPLQLRGSASQPVSACSEKRNVSKCQVAVTSWNSKSRLFLSLQAGRDAQIIGATVRPSLACRASKEDLVERSRSMQLSASALLAELLKADDVQAKVVENLDSVNEEFFTIASTYVNMAQKEGNTEVVKRLESTLKIAMEEKNKTLRPEIRLLNQLLMEKKGGERIKTIQANLEYLEPESYFFQLLNRFTLDVERQPEGSTKAELMVQLKSIARETKEASTGVKRTPKKGFGGK